MSNTIMQALTVGVLSLLLAVGSGDAVVEVHTPPRSECSVRDSSSDVVRDALSGGPQTWSWRAHPGETLQCDFEHQEPRDFTAVPDSSIEIAPEEARIVTLRHVDGEDITVEWLELTSEGVAHRAKRSIPAGDSRILVAQDDRILRVRRKGASPVSLILPAGKDPVEIAVPPPVSGGEILAVLPRARISPESGELRRAGITRTAPFRMRVFVASGLPPGEYNLHAMFIGGIRYSAATVEVSQGEGVTVPLLNLPSGGAVLDAPLSVCDRLRKSAKLTLHTVSGNVRSVAAVLQPLGDVCSWEIQGLQAPANFDASITDMDRLLATVRFTTEANVLVPAFFEDPSVKVSGRVSFGGSSPGEPVRVQFSGNGRVVSTMSAPGGFYEIQLPEPGEYSISASAHRYLPSQFLKRTVSSGSQTLDLDFAGGSLRIDFETADAATLPYPIQLSLVGGPTTIGGFVTEDDGPTTWIFGLSPGTYVLSAAAEGYTPAAPIEVRIESDSDEKFITVTLEKNLGLLRIVDESGNPIRDAQVIAWSRVLSEREPGIYPLRNVTPGTPIMVAASGWVPTCRRAKREGETLVLRRPFPADTEVLMRPTPPSGLPSVNVSGLPGAECLLGSRFFDIRSERLGDGTLLHFLNLPAGTLTVFGGRRSVQVDVPGPRKVLNLD